MGQGVCCPSIPPFNVVSFFFSATETLDLSDREIIQVGATAGCRTECIRELSIS